MIAAALLLVSSLWGAFLAWNALRPTYAPAPVSILSFLSGWLASELAPHLLVLQLAVAAGLARAGALASPLGWVALAMGAASWAGLVVACVRAFGARPAMERALATTYGPRYADEIPEARRARLADAVDWVRVAFPFPLRHADVERVRDVVYGRARTINLKLDVWRSKARPSGCPVLVQIHGGGWIIGSKDEQGLPLMQHLAARGWVCFGINYRLSPHATFPDHLVDVKRAIAWVREHAREWGGDPSFLVVTGGSAGGHLAALAALTQNDAEYQPGFEAADTSVHACVPFYGVYDFLDRHGAFRHDGLVKMVSRHVLKATPDEDRDAFDKASPISRVHAEAPPFLVVHGDNDTLVPVAMARSFVAELREVAREVSYAEIPGAQHAFEIFPSVRTELVVHGVARFVELSRARWSARAKG